MDAAEISGRRRGGGLIALLTTTVALAGGAYALAPASAVAFQAEEAGCTEVWEGTCVATQEDGSGGGGAGDAGEDGGAEGASGGTGWAGGADPGTGWDGGADDTGQIADNGGASGSDDSPADDDDSEQDPFLLASNDSTKEKAPDPSDDPAWQVLERKIQEAKESHEDSEKRALRRGSELDEEASIERRAQADIRAFDPGREIWQAAKCDQTAFPLRCGVFWVTLTRRIECEKISNPTVPWAEPEPEGAELLAQIAQCQASVDKLDGLLQELVKLGQKRQQHRARTTPGRRRHGVTARSAA